jgi:hypothetical protein
VDASIGLRAKTGKAIVVALAAGARFPELIFRREIRLFDPRVPATMQPYHVVMNMPWREAAVAARPSVSAIEKVSTRALADLIAELEARSFRVRRVGIVGPADRNLEKMGSPHVRAHAAEGILFRHALEVAVAEQRVSFESFSDKTIGTSAASFAARLRILGKQAGAPWRADEKNAATAALLALRSAGSPNQGTGWPKPRT